MKGLALVGSVARLCGCPFRFQEQQQPRLQHPDNDIKAMRKERKLGLLQLPLAYHIAATTNHILSAFEAHKVIAACCSSLQLYL
jgi:hypothetical protein